MAPSVPVLTGFDCISSNNHPLKLDYQPLFGRWAHASPPNRRLDDAAGRQSRIQSLLAFWSAGQRHQRVGTSYIIPLVYRDKPVSEDAGYEIGSKIKFWIYVTDTIGHSRVQPSLLGEDRECGGNQAYHPLLVDNSTCSFYKSPSSSSLCRPITTKATFLSYCYLATPVSL